MQLGWVGLGRPVGTSQQAQQAGQPAARGRERASRTVSRTEQQHAGPSPCSAARPGLQLRTRTPAQQLLLAPNPCLPPTHQHVAVRVDVCKR